jgi:hypothetical protein
MRTIDIIKIVTVFSFGVICASLGFGLAMQYANNNSEYIIIQLPGLITLLFSIMYGVNKINEEDE